MRTSVRFLISVTLLLSALNGIVLLSVSLALLTGVTEGARGETAAATQKLNSCYEGLLSEHDAPMTCFDELTAQLQALGPDYAPAIKASKRLRGAAATWLANGSAPDALEPVSQARFHVAGALFMQGEPQPVNQAGLLFMVIWVVGATLLILVVASQLRTIFSRPLSAISASAAKVAGGDLSVPIPAPEGGTELRSLAMSVESMRRGLVQSLARVDDERRLLRTMLDGLKDGVLLVDQNQKLISFNPSAARTVAAAFDTSLSRGQEVRRALPPLDRELLLDTRGGKQEIDLPGKGPVRFLTVRAVPVDRLGPNGEPGHVLVLRDVTRSVEVEDLKREFLSVVTHELKTPLTAVRGYVKLLLMGKGGPLSDKQTDLLGRTQDQVEVLGQMVQDLLDATRLEGGQLSLDLGEVAVDGAVREVVHAFAGEAETLGIRLTGTGLPGATVWADPFRLQQILGNLVRNALKFTPAGGHVQVSAKAIDGAVEFTVHDTGRGIEPASQKYLFRKFFQVETGDKRQSGGAGLGLYICSQLAQQMGGSIRCRSEVGQGSDFTVTLAEARNPSHLTDKT